MIEDRTLAEWFDTLRLDSSGHVAGILVIGGIGVTTLGVHVLHLATESEGIYTRLLGTLLPMGLSTVLLVMGARAYRHRSAEIVARIGAWCFVGAVVTVAMGVVSIAYQRANGVVMTDILFVVANHATVGAILGALIGSYDGQRHRRQRALRREHERTQQLSNRLTILSRVFRHDIRNAVNVILGHVNHIQSEKELQARAARHIEDRARELQAMSDCARRLERLLEREADATRPIDIAPSLRSKASALADDGVEVETTIPDSVEVYCTPMIVDAVEELLTNAVEHNDAAAPRVTVTVRVAAEANADAVSDTVTIRIGDNGPGIPEHELQVLERGHETELRHSSGLGLWFVHWVVDASNGWITFETDDSDGSVVGLHLPAANGEQSATVPPADAMWKERSFGHRNGQSAAGDR